MGLSKHKKKSLKHMAISDAIGGVGVGQTIAANRESGAANKFAQRIALSQQGRASRGNNQQRSEDPYAARRRSNQNNRGMRNG